MSSLRHQYLKDPKYPERLKIDSPVDIYIPPFVEVDTFATALTYKPDSDDIFLCTPPKCGTTWTQNILWLLLHNGERFEGNFMEDLPMLTACGGPHLKTLPTPRIIKTHLMYRLLPKSDQAKYIYVVRNPKDAVVSFFHHHRGFPFYNWSDGKFDDFFDIWITGDLDFGSYFDNVKGYLPHLLDENVLFLKYEDMLADHEGAVKTIGRFVGGRAAESVENEEVLAKCVEHSHFRAMSEKRDQWIPGPGWIQNGKDAQFLRKGKRGDWRNWLSKEQSDAIDAKMHEYFDDTEVIDWYPEIFGYELNNNI